MNLTTNGYCWYDNDEAANKNIYGALYNWYVVDMAGNGGLNVCPTGWHIPTNPEWAILRTYLGGESVAGGKLKETGTVHWISPNTGATNESGFTALPGGYRDFSVTYHNKGNFSVWWSSTEISSSHAYYQYIVSSSSSFYNDNFYKQNGYSIRCLKD